MHGNLQNFRVTFDDRDIVTVWLDVPGRPLNVFDAGVVRELATLIDGFEGDRDAKVVVFRSGKPSGFLAGADLTQITAIKTADEADELLRLGQSLFDRIERLPIPTVAVIHGPCLGGGLEFALACTYRVARDDAATRIGLPEVQLGLLPAWGGTQRLPKLIGLVPALQAILQGQRLTAKKAERLGLVDLLASPDTLDAVVDQFAESVAKRTVRIPPRPRKRGFAAWIANRTPFGRSLVFRATAKRIQRDAKNYPALPEIVEAIRRGYTSREDGLEYERQAFARLVFTPTARNLLELFFQREKARNPATWANGADQETEKPAPIERVGVVGAGVMGAGIAQLCADQGLTVVLRDVDDNATAAGLDRIRSLFEASVQKGRLRRDEANARLAGVTPTVDWEPLSHVDLAVEAVVERLDVKQQVFAELEKRLATDAVLATNTSSLSVEDVARGLAHPQRVAGLHFFNPVHKMELVEIVRTTRTSDDTVARLVRHVRQLGKTPLVVNDSPGFLVNRILFPYLAEAVRMVCEGEKVERIDREMRQFGMPMGPLELLDQVGLDVAAHVAKSMTPVLHDNGPTAERLAAMVERGWLGRKSSRGFYEYTDGKRGQPSVWEGDTTKTAAPHGNEPAGVESEIPFSPIQQRLIGPVINEAARCLGENVVGEAWIVDLAMVLGTGFAPFRGGPLRLADDLGIQNTITMLGHLKQQHGERFAPCETLTRMAENDVTFHDSNGEKPGVKKLKSTRV